MSNKMINNNKKSLLSLSKIVTLVVTILSFLLFSNFTMAADDLSLSALKLTTNPDGSQEYSVTLQILIFMTALSFIPAAVIMMTSFTRIVVVMAILTTSFWFATNAIKSGDYRYYFVYDTIHYDAGI